MNISVIIPLYNAERFIDKALDSCLQFQEVREIIVIDDGYPDKAMEIVRGYSTKHPVIKYYGHPYNENRGAGASRNLGITKATGDYIAFLDADDFFLPNRFDAEKVLLKKKEVHGVYGALGVYYYSQEAKNIFNSKFPGSYRENFLTTLNQRVSPEKLFDSLWGFNKGVSGYFSLDTFTIKSEVLRNQPYLFVEHLKLHQDSEFIYRLAYHCNLHPGIIDEPVAMRGVHEENRITNSGTTLQVSKNSFLMFDEMCKWAVNNKIGNKYINFLEKKKYLFQLRKSNQFHRILIYLNLIFTSKNFLRSKDPDIINLHLELFKNYFLKRAHMKILHFIK